VSIIILKELQKKDLEGIIRVGLKEFLEENVVVDRDVNIL